NYDIPRFLFFQSDGLSPAACTQRPAGGYRTGAVDRKHHGLGPGITGSVRNCHACFYISITFNLPDGALCCIRDANLPSAFGKMIALCAVFPGTFSVRQVGWTDDGPVEC